MSFHLIKCVAVALPLICSASTAFACDRIPTTVRDLLTTDDVSGCFDAFLDQVPDDRREAAIVATLDGAIYYGNLPFVQITLEAGAPLDGSAKEGFSPPLFEAIRWRQPDIVDFLLEAGADPNLSVGGEQSAQQPILLAALTGHAGMVRSLLDAGADPTGTTVISPLVVAAGEGYTEVVEMLFKAGGTARFHPDAPEGVTLMEIALYGRGDRGPVISALIAGGEDPAAPMSRGDLPLFVAASLGQGGAVRAIVGAGVPVNSIDRLGFTPLRSAAESGNLAGVRALLELGADPDFDDGAVALQANLNRENLIIDYLRAIGDPVAQQQVLNAALKAEVSRHFPGDAEALLREGADPNVWIGEEHLLNQILCFPIAGDVLLEGGADPQLMLVDGDWMPWVASCAEIVPEGADYVRRLGWVE